MKVTPLRMKTPHHSRMITKASLNGVELFGHSVVYFTMYYCAFNWMYYRNVRKQVEKIEQEKQNKKDRDQDQDSS